MRPTWCWWNPTKLAGQQTRRCWSSWATWHSYVKELKTPKECAVITVLVGLRLLREWPLCKTAKPLCIGLLVSETHPGCWPLRWRCIAPIWVWILYDTWLWRLGLWGSFVLASGTFALIWWLDSDHNDQCNTFMFDRFNGWRSSDTAIVRLSSKSDCCWAEAFVGCFLSSLAALEAIMLLWAGPGLWMPWMSGCGWTLLLAVLMLLVLSFLRLWPNVRALKSLVEVELKRRRMKRRMQCLLQCRLLHHVQGDSPNQKACVGFACGTGNLCPLTADLTMEEVSRSFSHMQQTSRSSIMQCKMRWVTCDTSNCDTSRILVTTWGPRHSPTWNATCGRGGGSFARSVLLPALPDQSDQYQSHSCPGRSKYMWRQMALWPLDGFDLTSSRS